MEMNVVSEPALAFGAFGLIIGLIYIAIFILSIYLVVTTIQFFKSKTRNDYELVQKLDELIRLLSQRKD